MKLFSHVAPIENKVLRRKKKNYIHTRPRGHTEFSLCVSGPQVSFTVTDVPEDSRLERHTASFMRSVTRELSC